MSGSLRILPLLLAVGSPGGLAPSQQDTVDQVAEAHAGGLLRLSQKCLQETLFNDAERLMLEAERWSAEGLDLRARQEELTQHRIARIQEDERRAYRSFLRSEEYTRRLEELRGDEQALTEESLEKLLDLARTHLRNDREADALRALESALALNSGSRQLERVAGKRRLERLRAKRAEERGLARMVLGDTITGPQVTLADLEGKVVLWRSCSL